MTTETYAYDRYIAGLFAPQDDALGQTITAMERDRIPMINVSESEGKLLHVIAKMIGARRILEIGTLGGYSGIHLARALPREGKLITLEIDSRHAETARANFRAAGVGDRVEVRVGPAAITLREMANAAPAPFDLIFIDANKDGYTEYLELSLPLLRVGGVLLADNTLPDAVLTGEESGTTRYNAAVASHQDLTTIIVPILRQRGLDGLTVSVKTGGAQ
jgi:caffeoyl-CoA O-methyltransferase